jgi:MoaA/NifB/PqqE/SkfB family radical SAM enzyme
MLNMNNQYKKIKSLYELMTTILLFRYRLFAKGPELVDLAITSACNHKCYFCDEHSYIKEGEKIKASTLKDDTLEKLFMDLGVLGVKRITLAGNGEQLLMPKTKQIIEKYGKKFKFQLGTNGTSLNKIDEKLFELIDTLSVSINSIDTKTHRIIHGYIGESEQLEGILVELNRLLGYKNSKDKILISYAITQDNKSELDKLIEFVEKTKCNFSIRPVHLIFKEMHDRGVGLSRRDRGEIRSIVLAYLQDNQKKDLRVRRIWKEVIAQLEKYDEMIKPVSERKEMGSCYSGFRVINIWSDGEVHQCTYSQESLGNINENNLRDIWRSKKFINNLCKAATMKKPGDAPYEHCKSCLEIQGNSLKIEGGIRKIPAFKKVFFGEV